MLITCNFYVHFRLFGNLIGTTPSGKNRKQQIVASIIFKLNLLPLFVMSKFDLFFRPCNRRAFCSAQLCVLKCLPLSLSLCRCTHTYVPLYIPYLCTICIVVAKSTNLFDLCRPLPCLLMHFCFQFTGERLK